MLLQAKPEVLSDEKHVEGGSTRPLITKNYSFGEIESRFGFKSERPSSSTLAGRDPGNIQKAPWLFIKQQITHAENARTLTELGVANQIRNQHIKAVGNFKKALSLDDKFVPAYKPLFNSLLALGRTDDAMECLTQLATILFDDVETQHELLLFKLAISGRSNTIKNDLLRLLQLHPSNAFILNSLGVYHLVFEEDGTSEAIQFFERSRKAKPGYAHPVNNLGGCYEKLKDLEKAETMFAEAIRIDRAYAQAWENLANIQIKSGNLRESLKTVRKALDDNIQLSDYWQHQEGWLLIQLGKAHEAAQWYEDRLLSEPNNPISLNNLGYCYELQGESGIAQAKYTASLRIARAKIHQQAPTIDARLLLPFYNMGRLMLRLGKISEVKKIGEELLGIHNGDSRGSYFCGTVAIREKDYSLAEDYLLKAIDADSSFTDSYIDLSFIYISINEDFDGAIKLLEPIIKAAQPAPIMLLNNYCDALIKAGHLKKAEQILEKTDVAARQLAATKGLLKLKQGNVTEARSLYEEAIKSLESPTKEIAEQTWLYEYADYQHNHGETAESIVKLRKVLNFPESYVTKWATRLLSELEK